MWVEEREAYVPLRGLKMCARERELIVVSEKEWQRIGSEREREREEGKCAIERDIEVGEWAVSVEEIVLRSAHDR